MSYSDPFGEFLSGQDPVVVTMSESAADSPDLSLTLTRLAAANEERSQAISDSDSKLATAALRSVVANLVRLLDLAAADLEAEYRRKDVRRIKKYAKRHMSASAVADVPLADVAQLLNASPEQAELVTQGLQKRGQLDPKMRQRALEQIQALRNQIEEAQEADDHDAIDDLVKYSVKLAQALVISTAATVAGTAVVGGSVDESLLLSAMISSLVTVVLQEEMTPADRHYRTAERQEHAKHALTDLTAEVTHLTTDEEPTYSLEPPVGRIRLLVKVYLAEQALLEVHWPDKPLCEELVIKLSRRIRNSPRLEASRLVELNEKLKKAASSLDES